MLRLVFCLLVYVTYIQAQAVQDICVGCVMVNGAGFNNHADCDKYVQCHFDANGALVGEVMRCPFATYWDMNFLTCLPIGETECKNDMCKGQPVNTVYFSETNCRGYFQCAGGKAQPMCCPYNFAYDLAKGCVEDVFNLCNDTCFGVEESPLKFTTCDKKSVRGKPDKYKQDIAGWGTMELPCAPGTLFVEDSCACLAFSEQTIQKPKCQAEIHLPFTKDHTDQSGKGHFIFNENVEVKDGVAIFNGINSRLVIPRFTNLEHSTTVIIKAKYSSQHTTWTGLARALVSNSDCGNLPTIMISEDNTNMYFGVGTNMAKFAFTSLPQSAVSVAEKEILYRFDSGVLSGSNGVNTSTVDAPGYLRNVKCALQIGHAENLQPFEGKIDEISIYLCDP